MLVRGGKLMHWVLKPEGDPIWSKDDWGRAATLEARWLARGICETDRSRLLPCAVWRAKFPGTTYDTETMRRLEELSEKK